MSLLGWIVMGLLAGFIASKIVVGSGQGMVMDIVFGIVGAIIGGWLFNTFGLSGVAGFNLYSLLVSVVGAVLLLVIYHALLKGPH
ncbi:MAG: Transglycosylase-associated protein [Proteobacteria bacterium]|nr:Transglycosylase-associated protein [Pseudomonadota bacterium]